MTLALTDQSVWHFERRQARKVSISPCLGQLNPSLKTHSLCDFSPLNKKAGGGGNFLPNGFK